MANAKTLLRKITIQQALENKDDLSLFVMPQLKEPGNINLTVNNNGVRTGVVIPTSFIPVDMAFFTEREALLRDVTFRRLVAAGIIAIVDTKQAQELIQNHPNAQREQKRILQANVDYDVKGAASDTVEYIDRRDTNKGPALLKDNEQDEGANISPFAVGVVDRVASGSEDIGDIIADIESYFNNLQIPDLEFIVSNVEDATLKQAVMDMIEQ